MLLISLTPVPANKMSFFVHSTMRNSPYVHRGLFLEDIKMFVDIPFNVSIFF